MNIAKFSRIPHSAEAVWLRTELLERAALGKMERSTAQPAPSAFVRCSRVGLTLAFVVGTGGLLSPHYVSARDAKGYPLQDFAYRARYASATDLTNSRANLTRIREAFALSITQLAAVFGVSRQTIYNWQAGQPIAHENSERIERLAWSADLLEANGLAGRASTLQRKLPGGRTVLESIVEGAEPDAAVPALVMMLEREQAQRDSVSQRFARRAQVRIDTNHVGSAHLDEQG